MKIVPTLFVSGIAALCLSVSPALYVAPPEKNHPVITGATPYDSVRALLAGYRWPTEDFLTITSSFADFRTTHFHGGIDISTHRKQGYRVFAAKSGYVSHISVSPYGYGKLLLVQHADGYRTAYAHLSRFNHTLEAYVEMLQHRQDKYPLEVNLDPGQFPVDQGDVIAYTGDTGIGVAHLHFEIHDENFNLVNPLLVPDFARYIKDSTPPEIRMIAFVPLDDSSRINDKHAVLVLNALRTRNHQFRFDNVVHCTGRIGVELYAMDHSDDTWYRSTATDLELFLDSANIWSSRITRVVLNETKQVALHFDWRLYKARRWYFQKLYVERGDDQPFYAGDSNAFRGIRTGLFEEGPHTLRVVVSDVFGNRSELAGTVLFNDPPVVDLTRDSSRVVAHIRSGSPVKSVTVTTRSSRGSSKEVVPASRLTQTGSDLSLPIVLARHSVVRIEAVNVFGSTSVPRFVFADTLTPGNIRFQFRKEIRDQSVVMTVWTSRILSSPPILEITSDGGKTTMVPEQTDWYRYVGVFAPKPHDAGIIRVSARVAETDRQTQELGTFRLFPVTPDEGGTVSSENNEFRIRFNQGGVYRPQNFQVGRTSEGYSVTPADVLLDKGGVVEYELRNSHPGRIGLFAGKEILDWTEDHQKTVLSGKAERFVGRYALLEDNTPPEISRVSASYRKGYVKLAFRLLDRCAGIEADSIRIRIDNEVTIGEFDPYAHYVHSTEYHPLSRGNHTITIQASDRMANTSIVHHTLFVAH